MIPGDPELEIILDRLGLAIAPSGMGLFLLDAVCRGEDNWQAAFERAIANRPGGVHIPAEISQHMDKCMSREYARLKKRKDLQDPEVADVRLVCLELTCDYLNLLRKMDACHMTPMDMFPTMVMRIHNFSTNLSEIIDDAVGLTCPNLRRVNIESHRKKLKKLKSEMLGRSAGD